MRVYLKVKIKSLAAEARIIRQEEQKLIGRTVREGPQDVVYQDDGPHYQARGRKVKTGGKIRDLKTLQAKSAIIEHYEGLYRELHRHRTSVVREEARASLMAYGYLRRKDYNKVEHPGSIVPKYMLARVSQLVAKYGYIKPDEARARIDAWYAGEPFPT